MTENNRQQPALYVCDPEEICRQIKSDNLKEWCEDIQVDMKMAMVKLPCWGQEGPT